MHLVNANSLISFYLRVPKARFDDVTQSVYGHVNDVDGVMATVDKSNNNNLCMGEMDVWNLEIPEDRIPHEFVDSIL